MTHDLDTIIPSAIFGVPSYLCTCGHRAYTYHDWITHSLD